MAETQAIRRAEPARVEPPPAATVAIDVERVRVAAGVGDEVHGAPEPVADRLILEGEPDGRTILGLALGMPQPFDTLEDLGPGRLVSKAELLDGRPTEPHCLLLARSPGGLGHDVLGPVRDKHTVRLELGDKLVLGPTTNLALEEEGNLSLADLVGATEDTQKVHKETLVLTHHGQIVGLESD